MARKESVMKAGGEPNRRLLLRIGAALVVVSYVFLAATFLFAALALGGNARLWGGVAGATYGFSWLLFITGFLLAGREAVRSGLHWLAGIFRRKARGAGPDQPPDDATRPSMSASPPSGLGP